MRLPRLITLLILILPITGCILMPKPAPQLTQPETITVVTYNVLKSNPDKNATLDLIESLDAGIVCLQETDAAWATLIRERLGAKYPHAVYATDQWNGRKFGTATLSRYPLSNARTLLEGETFFPNILATADTPIGSVQIFNVHLHPCLTEKHGMGLRGYYASRIMRRNEIQMLCAAIDPALPTVILGDYNDFPFSPAVKRLRSQGLKSAMIERRDNAHTIRYKYMGLNLGAQIDHIIFTPPLQCVDARVIREGTSDHRPLLAVLGK
ncbi:endonuclease/exonuclease/phosphatase family protein [Candidatus Sumerlaeota bacterium]|nr:endonuclease/exonuclease/phosphatase family protein [Candidatus Sumerlaeota bacterium]